MDGKTSLKIWKAMILKTGEIWWVNLDPTVGAEIRKKRPVVVINAGESKQMPLAIVAPITGHKNAWDHNPFFVTIEATPNTGLEKKSCVDCFQIRCLSHKRFIAMLGEIEKIQIEAIKSSLSLILDIEEHHCQ